MVDAAEHLLEAAKDVPNVGEVVVCGLQDFYPTKPYDMIWIQWVLSHLTDGTWARNANAFVLM